MFRGINKTIITIIQLCTCSYTKFKRYYKNTRLGTETTHFLFLSSSGGGLRSSVLIRYASDGDVYLLCNGLPMTKV